MVFSEENPTQGGAVRTTRRWEADSAPGFRFVALLDWLTAFPSIAYTLPDGWLLSSIYFHLFSGQFASMFIGVWCYLTIFHLFASTHAACSGRFSASHAMNQRGVLWADHRPRW